MGPILSTFGAITKLMVLDPRTNKHVEGWHSKINCVAGKPHPNIFEVFELFKGEQSITEINMQQLASGGATSTRRKYRLKKTYTKSLTLETTP